MDQGSLVNDQVEVGARFLREFQKYLHIDTAFWLKENEESDWNLYVVSQEITDDNFDVAYGEVLRIAKRLPDAWFDPFQVKLLGVNHPLARAILEIQGYYPGRAPTRLQGRVLGGVNVEDVYIYRLPPLVQAPSDESSVSTPFDEALPEPISRQRGIYVLHIGPPLISSPRFVHFSWGGPGGQSYQIRDYIGGKVLGHPVAAAHPQEGLQTSECPSSRDEIWNAAEVRVPARGELFHRAEDITWWKKKLTEMTEAFQSKQPA
jgi:hypothetical protein